MAEITGGCLCGRVRYTASGEPAFVGVCHCRNCQRYTGSAFEPVIAFPAPAVTVEGTLSTYVDTGDSGKHLQRRFCPNCGSGVVTEVEVMPGMILVLGGTLDEPGRFTPSMQIYCDSAQPWATIPGLKSFAKMPG